MSRHYPPATAAELDALQLPLPSVDAHDPGDEDRREGDGPVVMLPAIDPLHDLFQRRTRRTP